MNRNKVNAWLITSKGQHFQINRGLTTVGRSTANDVLVLDDDTVSGQHAKIIEKDGNYKIYDLGGPNGTLLNDQAVRGPMKLEPDDNIQIGDDTTFKFVTSRKGSR